MSKNIKGNQRHLTLSCKFYIEQKLSRHSSFRSIAITLGKDPSTISKEILRSSDMIKASSTSRQCTKYQLRRDCKERNVCELSYCTRICKNCLRKDSTEYCLLYKPYVCNQLNKPPYVCNGCSKIRYCILEQRIYHARHAQNRYENNMTKSREGINMTPEELQKLNDLISPLILKGQPLSHIFVVHSDEIPCSRRTLYNYLYQRVFQARNIDLPRCTQECVINAINKLTDTLSLRIFRKSFPVILTDNGPEFKNPYDIEKTPDGKQRTYVFYCDPYVSNQKARSEKNHKYIRYVIPKGRSLYRYNQDDINLLASHINSTARDSLNGNSPFDLAELLLDKRIPVLTGLKKVSPDQVMLKPALINK